MNQFRTVLDGIDMLLLLLGQYRRKPAKGL